MDMHPDTARALEEIDAFIFSGEPHLCIDDLKPYVERWTRKIVEIEAQAAEIEAQVAEDNCDHDWADARNSKVVSGQYCNKCGKLKSGN